MGSLTAWSVAWRKITIGLDENGEGFITDYGVNALVTQVEQGHGGVTTYFPERLYR